jgi:hypothetical protein
MELNRLDTKKLANDGAWMRVINIATGEETDIEILLAGVDSESFREARRNWENKRRDKLEKGAGLPTADELENQRLATLVACTLDWRNVEMDGQALACNKLTARHVYLNFPWLREQVDVFIGDRRNFLPPEAKAKEPIPEPEIMSLQSVDAYASEVGNAQSAGLSGDSA